MMQFDDTMWIGWAGGFAVLDNQAAGVGRFSDGNKPVGQINHGSLSDFVKLTSSYVPPELFEGVQSK